MRFHRTALLAALAFALVAPAAHAARQPLTFVLAGQSNMAGWGPAATAAPNPKVTVYTADGWRTAAEPLPGGGGASLAISFGNLVTKRTGRPVRLIQCAVGGSPLSRWTPDGDLYQACLAQVAAAHVATVSGFLFFQGESDTADPLLAETWSARFASVVAAARADFHRPLLPVVYAQLGTFDSPAYPYWNMVKGEQAGFAAPRVAMVKTDDMPQQPESMHFETVGYRAIGARFADAWLAFR